MGTGKGVALRRRGGKREYSQLKLDVMVGTPERGCVGKGWGYCGGVGIVRMIEGDGAAEG